MTVQEILQEVEGKDEEQKKDFLSRVFKLVGCGLTEEEAVKRVKKEMFGVEMPALAFTKSGNHSRSRTDLE